MSEIASVRLNRSGQKEGLMLFFADVMPMCGGLGGSESRTRSGEEQGCQECAGRELSL